MGKCFDLTDAEVAAYPPLTMQLAGTTLDMSSADYLLKGSPLAASAGQYCLGIRNGGSAGGSGFIIGDTTMRHYYLVFDLARRRIGWGKVNMKSWLPARRWLHHFGHCWVCLRCLLRISIFSDQ